MTAEAEAAAKKAINHVLVRISQDEDLRFRIGAGTESFHLLTEAASKLWQVPVEEVRNKFIAGSAAIHREAKA